MIEVTINGAPHHFEKATSIGRMVTALRLDPVKIAIECNGEIVPASDWPTISLNAKDTLEIIEFIGGG